MWCAGGQEWHTDEMALKTYLYSRGLAENSSKWHAVKIRNRHRFGVWR